MLHWMKSRCICFLKNHGQGTCFRRISCLSYCILVALAGWVLIVVALCDDEM